MCIKVIIFWVQSRIKCLKHNIIIMAGRRAVTEGTLYEDEDGEAIDLNGLDDE